MGLVSSIPITDPPPPLLLLLLLLLVCCANVLMCLRPACCALLCSVALCCALLCCIVVPAYRGSEPPASTAPWGIISVKGQLCDYELPMQPITMMRNALGAAEVGIRGQGRVG